MTHSIHIPAILAKAALALALTTGVCAEAGAQGTYIDKNGDEVNIPGNAITLTGSETELAAGTYLVAYNITYDHTLTLLSGTVNLILKDGCTMNVGTSESRISGNGIRIPNLTIYGQANGTGALSVYATGNAIRTAFLNIYGGNITANTNGDNCYALLSGNGDLPINRATVNATATGTGAYGIYGKDVTINGGNVTATAPNGTGICADNGNSTITLGGGTVTSYGGYNGTVTVALPDGYTYSDGSGNTYANGTLTDAQKSAIAGKTLTVTAPAVTYLDADGHEQTTTDFTILTDNSVTSLAAGTYLVASDITYDHTLTLTGDVNLILKDGCTMNVGTSGAPIEDANGIQRNGGEQSLTIYGQTAQTGTLSVYVSGNYRTAIGPRNLTINGGNVIANAEGEGANGLKANGDGGTITINRGNVNATATGSSAWGIQSSKNIAINGGNITASSIAATNTGDININGGNVNASSINCNGTITLGWNKPTDRIRIFASSYNGTVQVASDKMLHNGTGFLGGNITAAAVNGKTLRPAASTTYTTANGSTDTADAILLDDNDNSLPAGNYLATGTLNYTSGITLTGDVTLILADNCHMNVGTSGSPINSSTGIYYSNNDALTITSESLGDNMGALNIYTTGNTNHGIRANAITINGGNVTADTDGYAAPALNASGAVTINGGTVSANATGTGAHAIAAKRNFNYNGGNVTATAADGNAIYANGNYTFSWRTPADRITIGATGLYAPDAKTATFTRLFTDATGNYYGATLTGTALNALKGVTLTGTTQLVLDDTKDNTPRILAASGKTGLAVKLAARTLYKDGAWNTLCLPFAVDDFTGTPLEGAMVKTLVSTDFSTDFAAGTLTLNFTEDADNLTAIEAGKPYIVKWASGTNIVNPIFSGVTISSTTANVETTYADFLGTYEAVNFAADDKTKLFLGADNTLYYPKAGASVNAFRGYFQLKNDLTAGDKPSDARAFVLNFGEDEKTGITTTDFTDYTDKAGAWYDLSGRRLSGKPTKKGLYINCGKKVVVK